MLARLLCKKIVHEFTKGTWGKWTELFDRVLWVPLRKLKIQPAEGWGFEMLFYQEYFKNGGEDKGRRLAKELSQALLNPSTLFILDGLDEVSGGVEHRRLQDRLSVGALEST